ncbi:AtpZ/AtpI family protein [Leptotrichia sp. oral taxon 212]|jgi:hypothetical protein|uniref:AtpZ/AtpI family protein n=1 Tax=Leptotrichia sp. oral taxon 212 TaxID=712357 RepID=UPI0009F915CD|nr:AtpZ/AtpI family protein [Leptotrichia sp. oral taxon 212]
MSDILKKSSKSIKEVNKRDDTAENKYFEENVSDDIFSPENIGVGVEDSEEKRIKRLEKIEKRLGRYDKAEKIKHKKNNILMKYFLVATNMIYILAGPILLMLGAYLLLEKFIFKKQQPIVLIIFLIIGAFTGYWSLIKQVRDIK